MSRMLGSASAPLDDIVPNTGVCALANGRQVAMFRLDDDSLYAIGNHDPFSRANVLSRGIVGDLKGEVVVASPVYKQHFSLATGQMRGRRVGQRARLRGAAGRRPHRRERAGRGAAAPGRVSRRRQPSNENDEARVHR